MMALDGPLSHQSVSVAGTAVGITTITPADGILPTAAIITVENAFIRFCIDGTTATASVGHSAGDGDVIELTNRTEIADFSAISRDGGTATLKVTLGSGVTAT